VKRQANRKFSRFDSIFKSAYDGYRPKEGENIIRILPATWDGHEDYAYTIFLHRYVGQDTSNYLCLRKMLNKRCPICVEAERSRKAGEEEEARALSSVEGKVSWILNRDERKPKPQPYQIPVTLYKDVNALCLDDRTGTELFIDHPDEGYDLRIRRTGAQLNTRYLPTVERDPSPISDSPKEQDKLLDFVKEHPIPDILEFKSAEYLEKVMSGTGEDKDEDLDEDEDDDDDRTSKRKKLKSRKMTRRDEEEEDEEEEDEEEEEEDTAPRRARAKRKASDDDEEDEEDEDQEEEGEEDEEEDETPRRKLKTRRKPVDEEEEEEEDEDGAAYGDEEEDDRPKRKKLKSRKKDEEEDEEEEEEGDEEEEDEPEPRRRKKPQRSSVRRR
jgi:hypothetical protein